MSIKDGNEVWSKKFDMEMVKYAVEKEIISAEFEPLLENLLKYQEKTLAL